MIMPCSKKLHSLYFTDCRNLSATDIGFSKVYPMKNKAEIPDSLLVSIPEVGIPYILMMLRNNDMDVTKLCMLNMALPVPSQSLTVLGKIGHCDFCVKWSCEIHSKTASNNFTLEGCTPYEVVLGNTPDILIFMSLYGIMMNTNFSLSQNSLWINGLERYTHEGQAMCYYILPVSGLPIT
jgi:hypothetical protein